NFKELRREFGGSEAKAVASHAHSRRSPRFASALTLPSAINRAVTTRRARRYSLPIEIFPPPDRRLRARPPLFSVPWSELPLPPAPSSPSRSLVTLPPAVFALTSRESSGESFTRIGPAAVIRSQSASGWAAKAAEIEPAAVLALTLFC